MRRAEWPSTLSLSRARARPERRAGESHLWKGLDLLKNVLAEVGTAAGPKPHLACTKRRGLWHLNMLRSSPKL